MSKTDRIVTAPLNPDELPSTAFSLNGTDPVVTKEKLVKGTAFVTKMGLNGIAAENGPKVATTYMERIVSDLDLLASLARGNIRRAEQVWPVSLTSDQIDGLEYHLQAAVSRTIASLRNGERVKSTLDFFSIPKA